MHELWILIAVGAVAAAVMGGISALSNQYTLNGIKAWTVGDGQHGTARWATAKEIEKTYHHIPFDVPSWRAGKDLPKVQGIILGSVGKKNHVTALVDSGDIHCLMIGASGVGKQPFSSIPIWNSPAPPA